MWSQEAVMAIEEETPSDLLTETILNEFTIKVEFMIRKTEAKDIPQVLTLINDETRLVFNSCDAGKYYEHSVFSLVLTSVTNLKCILAHASFSDVPQDPEVNIDGKLWKSNSDLKGVNPLNTLFLRFYVCSTMSGVNPDTILEEIIGNAFLSCALTDHIIVESPSLEYKGIFNSASLCRETILTTKHKVEKKLLIFDKNIMFPKLKIREGREHDLDDLAPHMVINAVEMEEHFNKSYLNDVIAMSDRNNQSVVAEHESIAVGMLTVTTDINYSLLNNFFQLEPFHGLYKPHLRDEINLAYTQRGGESQVCTGAGERKYVTDDFDESVTGSDKNSKATFDTIVNKSSIMSDSASAFQSTAAMATPQPKKSGVADVGVLAHSNNDMSTEKFPNKTLSTQNDLLIPTMSTEDVYRESGRKMMESNADKEIQKFPLEVRQLYEELRQGHLDNEEVSGLDDELKTMLSKLEELMTIKGIEDTNNDSAGWRRSGPFNVNIQTPNREDVCYPMEIINEHKPIYHGIPNAIAIQLCVVNSKFSIRILDLIEGAFLCFPNREYCIITIPYGVPVPTWLSYFVRVIPRRQSLFDRELYVAHRNVLNCRLRVRRGGDRDVQKVKKLVDTLYSKDIILTDFYRANQSNVCGNQNGLYSFVAIAGSAQQSHVIGLIILSDVEKSDHYQVNYDIDSFFYKDLHEVTDHAYVHHFILNPMFRRFGKKVLKEVMRCLKKDVFYHNVYSPSRSTMKLNHQTLLNNLDDWYLVSPRASINYKKLGLVDIYDEDRMPPPEALDPSEPSALLLHSKKFTFDLKAEVTSRIVFVGASDTSLSCLQKMITTLHLNFLHLTLISPHGLGTSLKPDEIRNLMFPRRGGPSLSMDTDGEWFERAGIHIKVNIIYGKVTSLLREQKVVVVNRKEVVPYDILVLTVGQQFVRPDCGEVEVVDYHLNEFIEHSVNQDEKKKQKLKIPLRRQTKKPKNVFAINSEMDAAVALNYVRTQLPLFRRQRVLIHGACLEAYCCLNALLKMGVSPERMVFVIRPDFHMDWEDRRPYKDTVKLRNIMLETFKMFNIKVLANHDFLDWFLDLRTNTVTRVNFATPNESEIVSYSCFCYFGYNHRRISDEFLSALLDAYITFDKGISIGIDFKTKSDNHIWAAGPCSSYDNKLVAGKYDHTYYNSFEVGTLLAEKLIDELDPTKRRYKVIKTSHQMPIIPPILSRRLVHYAELPGGWCYMYSGRPGIMPKCCPPTCPCVACECKTEIVTGSTDQKVDRSQRYFRLWLDAQYRVDGIECLSKKPFSPWNLSLIHQVHESLLHNLVERFERGEISCLYNFLQQPWIAAICHDRWSQMKAELTNLYDTHLIDEDTNIHHFIRAYMDNLENPDALKVDAEIIRRIFESTGLKTKIELKFLDFLRFNRLNLPMYYRPDLTETLIEERRLSPLMLFSGNKY